MALGPAAFDRNLRRDSTSVHSEAGNPDFEGRRSPPLVSLVIPAYNEAAILERNLSQLCEYLIRLGAGFSWEIVLINDGSRDETGSLAEAFAEKHVGVRVVHHPRNQGLGQALRTGFAAAQGRYIVTLDLDLSYAPTHIERLVRRMQQTGAKVVVASPYMSGGRVSSVPPLRLWLSLWANRFLSLAAKRELSTLTGMVRAYDREFVRSLHPRASGMDINPELLHKARLLKAPVEEIPAHLHWLTLEPQRPVQSPQSDRPTVGPRTAGPQAAGSRPGPPRRSSSMKILRQIWSVLFYGFAFRPVMFFLLPSLLCLVLGGGILIWAVLNQQLYVGMFGALALILGSQWLSSAALSAQNKFYFEELFHLATHLGQSLDGVEDQSTAAQARSRSCLAASANNDAPHFDPAS